MIRKNWKLNALIVGALVLMAAIFAPSSEAADHRLMVRVNEAFEVNGEVYPAGKLTLRETGQYTPNATINEIWVDNRCLGMLLAHAVDSNERADADSFVFTRAHEGTLVLVGVTFRGEPVRELYQYSAAEDGRWLPPADHAVGTLVAANR